VLSIGKVGSGGQGYYVEAVAEGVDEYYRGVGEAPGEWTGTAAELLDLQGEVTSDDLRAIWEGRHPRTGEPLARFRGRTVSGYDLCFRAPKSVSVLFGLGTDDVASVVRDAHDAAVDAAFGYVEANAARSRIGRDGLTQIEVEGLVAAKFRHRTSRAGDPHLHTHVLVANMAPDADGAWRTLDGRLLYQYAKTAGYLYEAHLRHELTARLGLEWLPAENGIADLAGIDKEVLDHFSDRRREILEHLDEVGFRSARAAQLATLETRTAKDTTIDLPSLRALWNDKAAEIGFDPASLGELPGKSADVALTANDVSAIHRHLLGPEGLTATASSFDRRDALRAIATALPNGAVVADIEQLADDVLAQPEVVLLHGADDHTGLTTSSTIRRVDGSVVVAPIAAGRWSTRELIELEQRLVDAALDRIADGTGRIPDVELARVLADRPSLTDEQAEMVTRLVTDGNGVQVVCAAAGTGKTFTLDAARDAWTAAGYQVLGAAVAGRAAQELRASAGIESSTLAMLTIDLAAGRQRLDQRTILVIDEAGMAGTRTLAPILDAADRAGTAVVLVGDPRQLPEIDAGGVLNGLAHRLDPIVLIENRRQHAEWERDALAHLRHGDLDQALGAYERHGRIVAGRTAEDARCAMVADWWSYRLAGQQPAMLAIRRSDVDDLNGRARAYMVRAGQVAGPTIVIDDRPYQAGDDIVCLRNDRRLGVCNGTRATITTVDPDAHTVTIATDQAAVTLPATYLDAGHITHGYAMTIHKAQGATVDHGLLLGTDELYRARGYVGMSRGRQTNHLYLVGGAEPDTSASHGPIPEPGDAAALVRNALAIENHRLLAIDTGDPFPTWTLEQLAAEKRRLTTTLAKCPVDRSHDVRALSARHDQLSTDLASRNERRDELSAKRLKGRAVRDELTSLEAQIRHGTLALQRVSNELFAAQAAVRQRDQFLHTRQPDRDRLGIVATTLAHRLERHVDGIASDPPAYLCSALGEPPTTPKELDAWKNGARLIEAHRHDAGITDPDHAFGMTLSRLPASIPVEIRADLTAVQRTLHPDPVAPVHDLAIGL
jgi:conjugative relaxase-like TrwC/TraI family protein